MCVLIFLHDKHNRSSTMMSICLPTINPRQWEGGEGKESKGTSLDLFLSSSALGIFDNCLNWVCRASSVFAFRGLLQRWDDDWHNTTSSSGSNYCGHPSSRRNGHWGESCFLLEWFFIFTNPLEMTDWDNWISENFTVSDCAMKILMCRHLNNE